MAEHIWSQENLESYAAGGLTPEERERFERHAAVCADCARDLAGWRDVEDKLDNLFAEVRPAAGLEDRMIQTLRQTPMPRRFFRSTIVRFAMSAAAVVLLGVIGAGLSGFPNLKDLPFPGKWDARGWRMAAGTDERSVSAEFKNGEDSGKPQASMGVDGGPLITDDIDPVAIGGTQKQNDVAGLLKQYRQLMKEGKYQEARLSALKAKELGPNNVAADAATRIATIEERQKLHESIRDQNEYRFWEELEAKQGPHVSMDSPVANGKRLEGLTRQADGIEFSPPALGLIVRSPSSSSAEKRISELKDLEGGAEAFRAAGRSWGYQADGRTPRLTIPRFSSNGETTNFRAPTNQPAAPSLIPTAPMKDSQIASNSGSGKPGKSDPSHLYYRLEVLEKNVDRKLVEDASSSQKDGEAKNAAKKLVETFASGGDVHARPGTSLGLQKPEAGAPTKMARKIIRTGDIEFEVDSFDTAVERINALINATKGAFIATTNSDKLPNGKVKGSVVVRMPPENLDKFLLDLRKDLGKMGELKSQRIGSQDISKQYTDIESRLRAARTMEERLLKIIQSGKGEVKDLVAAERELGNWRTKIEEMEGEIRYYNNQVSLSTLTIALFEKEIRSPSALVVTERITMRIETEDVEKAQQSAVKAVMDAKGRVTKSELKQHAAGQLEAIVTAEVAPAAAEGLRTRFRQLGIVTKLDSDRLQQAEGGSGNLTEIKTRQNDVQFNLTLYNVANIQPRETFNVQVATLDVPGSFRKLQDTVTKAKGQVRKGQLNEQDKLNVTAEFDFDVPGQDKKMVDTALEEAGRIISRSTAQAPPSETVTDSKVGYRVVLRSVASIQPREKVTMAIEVKDVEKTADEFISLVRAQKGTVAAARDNQDPSGKITALLLFDVPLASKDELLNKFKTAGRVRVRQTTSNPQVPDNDLATAHLDVTLAGSGPIVPSDEGLWPQIRTSLFYSFKMLSWSVMFIILGLAVVVPWALVIWGVCRVVRRLRGKVSPSP
jgi:hypothetical protein